MTIEWKPRRKTREYLDQLFAVAEGHEWPLTVRQLHYLMVSAGHTPNDHNAYRKVSTICTKARGAGLMSWEMIVDRSRRHLDCVGCESAKDFIRQDFDALLTGYRRDRLQSQSVAVEIWSEKDTLAPVLQTVADQYSVPVVITRGFPSASYRYRLAQRAQEDAYRGKETRLLHIGDFDPSGREVLPSLLRKTRQENGIDEDLLDGTVCALNIDQIEKYALPPNPEKLKEGDPRTEAHRGLYGELWVEVDALPPSALRHEVRQAIEELLDLGAFEAELQQEQADIEVIDDLRDRVQHLLGQAGMGA